MALDRVRGAGVVALVLALSPSLAGCTAPAPDSAPATTRELPATRLASQALPSGVPLTPGTATLVRSELVGEFSRFPRARWVVRVLTEPVADASEALGGAERELRASGYQRLGDGGDASPLHQLWMERAGTTVVVRTSAGMPRLLEYTMTRSYTECARSYCD